MFYVKMGFFRKKYLVKFIAFTHSPKILEWNVQFQKANMYGLTKQFQDFNITGTVNYLNNTVKNIDITSKEKG